MAAPAYNLLDRAIGYFAPVAGLRRAMARRAAARVRAYEGASTKDGWIPRRGGASARADHAADATMLRHRARSLVQNNPYAAKALASMVANVIGEGIAPNSAASSEKIRNVLDARWAEWVRQADANGNVDWYGLQSLAYAAMETDGEVLIRLRVRRASDGLAVPLQLQVLEIDYLDSTKNQNLANGGAIYGGVETDAIGRIVGYWLFDAHPGDGAVLGGRYTGKSSRVDADKIIHLFAPRRPGQQRGISRYAPVIALLRDLAIYEDAELARKQNESLLSVFVSGDGADFAIPGDGESAASAQSRANQFGTLGQLAPGAVLATNGQSVTVAKPDAVPGYADYVRTKLYAVAAGLRVTYEMLTGDLSQVNFASGRMGLVEFRRDAAQVQWQICVPVLCEPVWRAFVDACVLAGHIDNPDYAVEHATPKWEYVNPAQDIRADVEEIKAGLSSVSEKLRKRGYKPAAVFKELGEDYKAMKAAGAIDMMLAIAAPASEANGRNGPPA